MADIRPFRGWRYGASRRDIGASLCPPYDAISPGLARRLRKKPLNAIHLELPQGENGQKYANAAKLWRSWQKNGIIAQDQEPSFYACEEKFPFGGRTRARFGLFAGLGITPKASRNILRHERTLPKPKADRLKMLRSVGVNLSPIFGLFPDSSGAVRRLLRRVKNRRPDATGHSLQAVSYRLWRVSAPAETAFLRRALGPKQILIADGHHRCEVSRLYYGRTKRPEAETTLAFLCPEEDGGLVVLPTHRIVQDSGISEKALGLCRQTPVQSVKKLMSALRRSKNPYAFGLYPARGKNGLALLEPKNSSGCSSGLAVEWLDKKLLGTLPGSLISYTAQDEEALRMAKKGRAAAFWVKPFAVGRIRKAVESVGLLPPKSTYFYPKVATGLVFKSVAREPQEKK